MTSDYPPHLLVFGPGYSARAIIDHARKAGWTVSATFRRPEAAAGLEAEGLSPVDMRDTPAFAAAMAGQPPVSHVLMSIAPGPEGDPALAIAKSWLERQKAIRWIGYLSSTNVYGDHDGGWVDEETAPAPSLERGHRRVEAEAAWRMLANHIGADLHIFRLAGIYGPGRNAVRTVLDGRARRIVKAGQVFSRIHVADIGDAIWRAMTGQYGHQVFNLADDRPAPPGTVIEHAARLLGQEPPAEEDFDTADMSEMARSFYLESKKVKNSRAKQVLGWQPLYPDYEKGLADLLDIEVGKA